MVDTATHPLPLKRTWSSPDPSPHPSRSDQFPLAHSACGGNHTGGTLRIEHPALRTNPYGTTSLMISRSPPRTFCRAAGNGTSGSSFVANLANLASADGRLVHNRL